MLVWCCMHHPDGKYLSLGKSGNYASSEFLNNRSFPTSSNSMQYPQKIHTKTEDKKSPSQLRKLGNLNISDMLDERSYKCENTE